MSPGNGISRELRPYVDSAESEALDRVGERLERERPIPSPAFRSELGVRLSSRREPWRPRRLGLAVAAYAGSGLLVLTVAALGLGGTGPLGY